jgi:aryl-alcohol dehydrogenase-like predicted oxidoreductase
MQSQGAISSRAGIPYRLLGSTGENVSLVGLGGGHIGIQESEAESIGIIRTAIDNGINFLDNSWDYSGGASEVRMGKALRDGYRDKVFLMTKIDGQTGEAAMKQLDECLRRLQVETIDLLQFHEVIRLEDAGRVFAPSGGMEAVLKAKEAGKLRYIGFTGHKSPEVHLRMLRTASENGFTFDAVQMPLNLLDTHFRSFEREVLPCLVENGIGVLGMKPMAAGALPMSGTVTATECLHYAMSLPTSTVITGCESLARLEQALEAARSYRPLSEVERSALLSRTAGAAEDGGSEGYKTTAMFDATSRNPHWLG